MKKKTLTQIPLEVSVRLRKLFRHAEKPAAEKTVDKRKDIHGRPR